MPLYKTLTIPASIFPGDQYLVFTGLEATAPIAGQSSERVALAKPYSTGLVFIGVELQFVTSTGAPSAPSTFEIDIQEADTDVDAAYQTVGTLTTVNSTTQFARADLQVTGTFVRAYIKTLTNAVFPVVKISQR